MRVSYTRFPALCGVLFLAACASHGNYQPSSEAQPTYKVGQPYEVGGDWYYPRTDYSYDETGIASWYGQGFNGGRTANGEIFNKDELTAAHKTLPLPTLARVTNLENGRSIVVRINDRGPFSGSRIIDVSQRAAQLLGFEQQGTAKVRVQVLADESKAIADAMRRYGAAAPVVMASAEQPSPESANLNPIETTPAIHRQLLATKPVQQVVHVPVAGAAQIYVQAGAFTVLANATRLQQSLSAIGPTTITEAMVNGRKFYRVRVGPAADVAIGDRLLTQVKQAGSVAARIVID